MFIKVMATVTTETGGASRGLLGGGDRGQSRGTCDNIHVCIDRNKLGIMHTRQSTAYFKR